jgi:histone deacetylase 1/2
MMTRGKHGFRQPKTPFNLHAISLSLVPSSYRSALADPNWREAMTEEYSALIANNTWELVRRPSGANIVTGKWVYRHKYRADGSLERYKAR